MSVKFKASLIALATVGLLTACGGSDDGFQTPSQPMSLTILHINDHHSNLDESTRTLSLKNDVGESTAVEVSGGGFPRVTTAFRELAANQENVLKLHAGDAQTGTLFFNRAGAAGQADAELMNTVCFDAMALGNHEFDKGDAGLDQFIDFLHGGACQTPVLSANVQFGASSPLHNSDKVQASTVVERSGQKIAIVGLTIAKKTKMSSSPNEDTLFEEEVVAAQREIDKLTAQGVNKIVVLSHVGYNLEKDLISQLSGVDVVVGGDSHTLLGPQDALKNYADLTVEDGYDYPTKLLDKDGSPVCLVQAWERAQVVGELKVDFDAQGRVQNCEGVPHLLIDDDYQVVVDETTQAPTEAERAAFNADIKASQGLLYVAKPDETAVQVLAPYKEKVEAFKAKTVATVPQDLCNMRVPEGSLTGGVECSEPSKGGDVQQLVAQAFYDMGNSSYGGVDFSLQNAGGVRVPLLQGPVTAARVIEVLPFGNSLWTITVTGQELKEALEDGIDAVVNGSTGPYPYAGGLRWSVDMNAAKGNRISNLQVWDKATQSWKLLDARAQYKGMLLSFLAQGGDGYNTFKQLPADRLSDVGVPDADTFQEWIDAQAVDPSSGLPALLRLDNELYSTQSFIKKNN